MDVTYREYEANWRNMPVWALLLICGQSRKWREGFEHFECYRNDNGISDLVYVFSAAGYWVLSRDGESAPVYFVSYF